MTLGPEALAAAIKTVEGLPLTPGEAGDLIAACAIAAEKASFDDLASEAFEAALQKKVTAQDERINADLARRKRELNDEAERDKLVSSMTGFFSGDADDGGPGGRVLACLPYLLPLVDGLPSGGALADVFPFIYPILVVFSPLLALKNAIPFGTFIFLIGFQFLCKKDDLPDLLRYNLRQACVIDILILLPQFITGFVGIELPEAIDTPLFILMVLSVGYSLLLTALGKLPSGLGFVSDATERGL